MSYVHLREDEDSLRRRLAVAFTETATDFGGTGQIETLVDAALGVVTSTPPPDLPSLLLGRIQSEGGFWTGTRASRALHALGWDMSPERCVQFMQKLVERGQLVVANPPRGRTFSLPHRPGISTWHEWSTPTGDGTEPVVAARTRGAGGWRTAPWEGALLRREVTYGPWVEVAVDGGSP